MSDPVFDLSVAIRPPSGSGPPAMPRRVGDRLSSLPSVARIEPVGQRPPLQSDQVDPRTMVVGSGVSLTGEIHFCDRLVLSGNLEASIHECRKLEISPTGIFRGNAVIMTAEIRGRFEGDLVVRKRLVVRATGYVSGSITYGELEIEAGAEVAGILMPERKTGTSFLPPALASRP